ncbi:MAG: hypothetical protein COV10_03755 [Candidatus Vogelbacteria bacterium CG10_big_fil_rev_8_21_14_0_10_51_16]|uniref:Uncharacterized protein n=1 Tax=Candidatus Vogelbacteria bacterium CG10_big_fil_rev_8_21_14_0_10_51_16 TaxID=1975045 RepID=A0A2H0RDH1_9BACT|nr:MAG: hypothetical protein COV10_03755 [Candidatus Vogelbacteria bacterium CG10_big_fil_rev_8_21_14_0_10_51_16]
MSDKQKGSESAMSRERLLDSSRLEKSVVELERHIAQKERDLQDYRNIGQTERARYLTTFEADTARELETLRRALAIKRSFPTDPGKVHAKDEPLAKRDQVLANESTQREQGGPSVFAPLQPPPSRSREELLVALEKTHLKCTSCGVRNMANVRTCSMCGNNLLLDESVDTPVSMSTDKPEKRFFPPAFYSLDQVDQEALKTPERPSLVEQDPDERDESKTPTDPGQVHANEPITPLFSSIETGAGDAPGATLTESATELDADGGDQKVHIEPEEDRAFRETDDQEYRDLLDELRKQREHPATTPQQNRPNQVVPRAEDHSQESLPIIDDSPEEEILEPIQEPTPRKEVDWEELLRRPLLDGEPQLVASTQEAVHTLPEPDDVVATEKPEENADLETSATPTAPPSPTSRRPPQERTSEAEEKKVRDEYQTILEAEQAKYRDEIREASRRASLAPDERPRRSLVAAAGLATGLAIGSFGDMGDASVANGNGTVRDILQGDARISGERTPGKVVKGEGEELTQRVTPTEKPHREESRGRQTGAWPKPNRDPFRSLGTKSPAKVASVSQIKTPIPLPPPEHVATPVPSDPIATPKPPTETTQPENPERVEIPTEKPRPQTEQRAKEKTPEYIDAHPPAKAGKPKVTPRVSEEPRERREREPVIEKLLSLEAAKQKVLAGIESAVSGSNPALWKRLGERPATTIMIERDALGRHLEPLGETVEKLSRVSGLEPRQGETARDFLNRAISKALVHSSVEK